MCPDHPGGYAACRLARRMDQERTPYGDGEPTQGMDPSGGEPDRGGMSTGGKVAIWIMAAIALALLIVVIVLATGDGSDDESADDSSPTTTSIEPDVTIEPTGPDETPTGPDETPSGPDGAGGE